MSSLLPAYQTPLMRLPNEGSKGLENKIVFPASGIVERDFFAEFADQQISFIQSVYIDNSKNSAPFEINFRGTDAGQTIVVQAYHQGVYPVSSPTGALYYRALGVAGTTVPVIFFNCAMPYAEWGPADGVLVTPALLNEPVQLLPCIAGDNILVAGVLGQSIHMYRGMFSVDNPTILRFTDGAGGALLFAAQLTAGGSLNFQASGIPWLDVSAGNDLVLNSSAAVNLFGGFGYTQT